MAERKNKIMFEGSAEAPGEAGARRIPCGRGCRLRLQREPEGHSRLRRIVRGLPSILAGSKGHPTCSAETIGQRTEKGVW